MNSLSQLTPAVRVDTKRCQAVATRLEAFNFPSAAEDAPLAGIAQPLLPNTYFLAVAICHQTSPRNAQRLGGYLDSGQEAGGWDFLRLRLAERIAQNPELATPALWVTIDEQRLGDLFSDARGQRTLSDVGARATLVRDLGVTLRAQGIETVGTIFDQEGGNLEQGGMGLLPRLERFRAYRDPIRKKSFFFLELMKNSCGWRFRDPENLGAPVDYHEVRGHLRLGTVIVEEPALLAAIRAEEAVDGVADLALRGAVASAISLIARTTGRSPSDLHYLFWNVFRNCCSRAAQHCSICPSACGLPLRYRDPSAGSRVCLFSSTCASAGRADKLIEHVHETDFY